MKFASYILLFEDTNAIDFGPDSSTRLQDNLVNGFWLWRAKT